MYHKVLTLIVVSVVISLFFAMPNDAFGVNTLKNVINFTGTYPAGVDEHDITLSTSLTNKSKAFSIITFQHATDNDASASFRSWEILNTTTIRIYGHSGTPANNDAVQFIGYVIEYTNNSDMFVQHENFTLGASTTEGEKFRLLPTPINSSSTMILPSGIDFDGVNTFIGTEEFARWRIVNNTHWGWTVGDTPATGDNNIFAQIVDWNIPTVRVQTGNTTMVDAGSKTVTQTPPIAVQNNQTMFFATYETDGATDEQSNRLMLFMALQENGDMVFNRDSTNFGKIIQWQLVEFFESDILVIHNGTCTAFGTLPECEELGAKMASGTTTFDFPIPAVNTTTTIPFSPNAGGFGFSNGRAEGGDRGRIDSSMVTMELTNSTNVRMTRGASSVDGGWGLEVVTWGDVRAPQTFDQEVSDIVTAVDLETNMNITKVQTDIATAGDTVNANAIFVVELTDQGAVLDVTSLNITKLNTDTVTALDETNFNISIGVLDTATILDLVDTNLFASIQLLDTTNVNDDLQFAITKALTDLSTVLDDPDKDIDKTIADVTTIIDQAEPEVIRRILELDTVTASDEVRLEIIKAIIDVITNSDDLNFSLDKILSDTAVVSDLIDSTPTFGVDELDLITASDLVILDVTKLLSDVASAIDDLDLQPTKVFIDTTIVTDTTQVDKESGVDLTDSVGTVDDLIFDASKLILDLSTTQDQVVVLKLQEIIITDTITVDDPTVLVRFQTQGGNVPIPSGGGGGGVPTLQRLVGLSIQSELFFVGEEIPATGLLQPTTVPTINPIPSDFIIQTFGREDSKVTIENIQTDQQFTTWFQFSSFPQTLLFKTEVDRDRAFSDPAKFQNTALNSFVLTIPAEKCDNQDLIVSVACIDPIVYEIPVTFTFKKSSVIFNERHIVTVDASRSLVCDPICELVEFLTENYWWLAGIVIMFMLLYFLGGKVIKKGGTRTLRRIDRKAFTSFEAKPKRKFKRGKG